MAEPVWTLLGALAFDLAFGEPPSPFHPVVWMGWLIRRVEAHASKTGPRIQLLYGVVLIGLGLLPLFFIRLLLFYLPLSLSWPLEIFLLKTAFSIRALFERAIEVKGALEEGRLEEARRLLGFHLVSRETKTLDQAHVASGVVESVAENLTDSIVAPLLFYALFGLYGALFYRFVNTADAMLGYRYGIYEFLGKAAARLDDLFNLLPAPLSGLLLVGGAGLTGRSLKGAWLVMWRDRGMPESPNAGWTMAAMAGALGVVLEKPGCYTLGENRLPGPAEIGEALRIGARAIFLFIIGEALLLRIL